MIELIISAYTAGSALMALRAVYLAFARVLASLVLLARTEASKDTEILVLRQQLAVPQRTTRPPRMSYADRALVVALARLLPNQRRLNLPISLRAVPRWHRALMVLRSGYSPRNPAGGWRRPPPPASARMDDLSAKAPPQPLPSMSKYSGRTLRSARFMAWPCLGRPARHACRGRRDVRFAERASGLAVTCRVKTLLASAARWPQVSAVAGVASGR